jgi:transcriptional regulator with XRE-family HTH domain
VSRSLVEQVRGDLGVSRRLFARLTGYSERAIAAWESGRELSEASRQRMLETRRLEKALARVLKPSSIAAWLEEPNRAFRGLKPLEIIERGEVDRIWRMVFELESGVGA